MKSRASPISYFVLGISALCSLFPFIMLCLCACNTSNNIKKGAYISEEPLVSLMCNLNVLFQDWQFAEAFINTFFIAVLVTLLSLGLALIFCYLTLGTSSRTVRILVTFIILGILIPANGVVVSLFTIMSNLGLLNSIAVVILMEMPLSFTIFLLYQCSKKFPYAIIESARVDGIAEHRIFFSIYLHGISSSIVMAGVTAFISSWNNLMTPLVFLDPAKHLILSVYLSSLNSNINPDMGVMMLALLINTLPTLIVFLLFQKQYREGFEYI